MSKDIYQIFKSIES